MAQGLPVISTNRCIAALEMLKDGKSGVIVPVGESQVLAEKIKLLIESEEMLETMGNCALTKIREYTIEEMAKRHMEIFRECKN